jgi:putative oxidoreductase
MDRYLKTQIDRIYALTRIAVGFLFLCHGVQKILGLLGGLGGQPGTTAEMFSLIWFAGIIELVGGSLICVGLFTGWAAFLCSGLMAVAYFMAHVPNGLFPILNGGEKAAFYAWVFLLMAARGSGPWSLDSFFRGGSSVDRI